MSCRRCQPPQDRKIWPRSSLARPDKQGARALPPHAGKAYRQRRTRKPGSRWYVGNCVLEESPGSNKTGRRLTAARRKPRESATESKPPGGFGQGVRVKGWGKSPPQAWQQGWQGKPRPEQDQVGGTYGPSYACAPGVSREAFSNDRPRGMAARSRKGRTEPGLQAFWSNFTRKGCVSIGGLNPLSNGQYLILRCKYCANSGHRPVSCHIIFYSKKKTKRQKVRNPWEKSFAKVCRSQKSGLRPQARSASGPRRRLRLQRVPRPVIRDLS
jgi:hypothetical protein